MKTEKNVQNEMPQEKPKGRPGLDFKILARVFRMLVKSAPVMVPVIVACIIFCSICAVMPAVFQQKVIAIIEEALDNGWTWEYSKSLIIPVVLLLISFYVLNIVSQTAYRLMIATVTQGFLAKTRKEMFEKMQNLPISYFDTHKHGDIMSTYTNDIDTLRELVSQAFPQLLTSGMIVVGVFCIMLYYSIWLALIVVAGVLAMLAVSGKLGGGSAKYFIRAQKSMGKTEGFIQEMMNGQKVVKVFTHEKACVQDFDKINDALYEDNYRAHAYANTLGPIIMNIGNLLYVITATVGGVLLLAKVPNPSIQSLLNGVGLGVLTIDIVIPFLNMTKQFTGNVNQLAQQVNTIAMASAGAKRVFELMDTVPEADDGYVTLVNCEIAADGTITETDKHTGHWAWKHPHQADGTVTYTELKGDVRLTDVDFEYVPGKQVLYDVSVYAEPGQKVAFVGATGAGKTTITNLINRFYDIADGKIRYDGINVNKIKKSDLRRSLGIVLQDTNLFSGCCP